MSRTSPVRHRFGRLAAGLSVAAAVTGTTLLGALPAEAATPVTARMFGTTLSVTGTSLGDSVTAASGSNGTISLSNLLGSITAGPGCAQLGATVQCSGATSVGFNALGGDDTFTNNTSKPSILSGGDGSDRLTGGSAADRIVGGNGVDFAFGNGGIDRCLTENKSSCES